MAGSLVLCYPSRAGLRTEYEVHEQARASTNRKMRRRCSPMQNERNFPSFHRVCAKRLVRTPAGSDRKLFPQLGCIDRPVTLQTDQRDAVHRLNAHAIPAPARCRRCARLDRRLSFAAQRRDQKQVTGGTFNCRRLPLRARYAIPLAAKLVLPHRLCLCCPLTPNRSCRLSSTIPRCLPCFDQTCRA